MPLRGKLQCCASPSASRSPFTTIRAFPAPKSTCHETSSVVPKSNLRLVEIGLAPPALHWMPSCMEQGQVFAWPSVGSHTANRCPQEPAVPESPPITHGLPP